MVKAEGVTYRLRKLSGFALMNTMGGVSARGQTKSQGEIYRDLIQASLIEPALEKKDIEELAAPVFIKLGTTILENNGLTLEGFQNALGGDKK